MPILISGLHVTITADAYYAGDLIGFTTGLLITVLLLALTLRAAKLPGTPRVNIVFAVCALLWCAGGLAQVALLAFGAPRHGRWALMAQAIQYSGAAAFPIPVLAIWRPFAVASQENAARILRVFACVSASAIAILLWSGPVFGAALVPLGAVKHIVATAATLLLVLGALTSLRRASVPRAVYLPSLAIVVAVCGVFIETTIGRHARPALLENVGAHLVLLVVLCAFFLFARFRFADLFIRYGVRILLAGLWASVLAFAAQWRPLFQLASRAASPWAIHVFGVILFASALLLSFTFMDARIGTLVNRWLFNPPDYRTLTRELARKLGELQLESEIAAACEDAARGPLQLSGARFVVLDSLPPQSPAGVQEGEIVELDSAELLIPVAQAGRVTHVFLISPGPARPGLVTRDLNYLRAIAAQCGNRLDALHREREAIERQSREALLLQQVTEAELRALRAQVNPHFLFNSLNTIADLVVRDAPRAEVMTLRLASVFRHVLAHASRPLTSIREEIEFLRTYLYIEEARFGDRLRVEIDIAPEAAGELLPSLILQPLVENALKHGLAPKPGPGRLWISAHVAGDRVRIIVEDDGIGPASAHVTEGHGLTNVAERLRTQYQGRASVILEPREAGGSRVTMTIPRGEAMQLA